MGHNHTFTIVLLAGGSSSRLGQAKQLVQLNGESLLRRQCKLALELTDQVTVVLGSNADLMIGELADLPVTVVLNPLWSTGMASSISAGVKQIKECSNACLLLLVDQWLLTADDLKQLISAWQQSPNDIWLSKNVAKTASGPPVIFPSHCFSALENISGEQGAKPVIRDNIKIVKSIEMENAFTDLDTPEQLAYCLKKIAAINPNKAC